MLAHRSQQRRPVQGAGIEGDGNAGTYGLHIQEGYFSLIALNFTDTTALDHDIAADIHHNHHYHYSQVIPYGMELPPIGNGSYIVWQYKP